MFKHLLFCFISLTGFTQTNLKIFNNSGDKIAWNNDSDGCNNDRFKLHKTVSLKCQKMNRKDILSELGKPNKVSKDNGIYYYHISYKYTKNQPHTKMTLVLFFNSDTVVYKGTRLYCK